MAVPGSMPRTTGCSVLCVRTLASGLRQDAIVELGVGVDLLDVVEPFQPLDQLDDLFGDLVRIAPVRGHDPDATRLEDPGDRAGLAERAAAAVERRPHLADRAVAVVGDGLDQDRRAAGAVPLVGDLLELLVPAGAGRL